MGFLLCEDVRPFGKMARGLIENLATAYATPQDLKRVMSIAVEKRNLTANNLSERILLAIASNGKPRMLPGLSGGDS